MALGLAGLGLVLVLPLHQALLLAVLAQLAAAGVRGARRRRAERDAIARRLRVVEFTEALVGELRAGLPVTVALQRAIDVWPEAAPVASAARWGADVPTALGHLAELPGAGSVGRLGSVWSLCAGSGSSLAVGVGHILETARAEEATRHVVAAELASARATARMLGLMPVLVLVAGQALGAEPWAFLLDTMPGVLCLTVGSGFALAGLAWLDRIADRAVTGVP